MDHVYPNEHWIGKIKDYASKSWAGKPSPFAIEVQKLLQPESSVLELGTGAGQDAIFFARNGSNVVATDATDQYFSAIIAQAEPDSKKRITFKQLDVTSSFTFEDNSFDIVYAHLVLHYFEDKEMKIIVGEIERVLKPGGLVAIMVNSINDEEYDESRANNGIIKDKITKRYFSLDSLKQFLNNFEVVLADDQGRTPKDDAVGNSGMIRFIGKKHG